MTFVLRTAVESDGARVAEIWHRGWIDGHLGHVDQRLTAARTSASFLERTRQRLAGATAVVTTVAVDPDGGRAVGFVMVVDDEVEQVYVASEQRGAGCAALLLSAAESTIAAAGHSMAWLAVVAGNKRARSFYARLGWIDRGAFTYLAVGPDGTDDLIPVEAHRYEKSVADIAPSTIDSPCTTQ